MTSSFTWVCCGTSLHKTLVEKGRKPTKNRPIYLKCKQRPLTQEPLKAKFLQAHPSEQAPAWDWGLANQRPRRKRGQTPQTGFCCGQNRKYGCSSVVSEDQSWSTIKSCSAQGFYSLSLLTKDTAWWWRTSIWSAHFECDRQKAPPNHSTSHFKRPVLFFGGTGLTLGSSPDQLRFIVSFLRSDGPATWWPSDQKNNLNPGSFAICFNLKYLLSIPLSFLCGLPISPPAFYPMLSPSTPPQELLASTPHSHRRAILDGWWSLKQTSDVLPSPPLHSTLVVRLKGSKVGVRGGPWGW